jgi:1-deoxy-D-xylulose-5-phosphate synthase
MTKPGTAAAARSPPAAAKWELAPTGAANASRILETVRSPADLRRLSVVELRRLAAEIRDLIIATVARNGGHLAPSLGVVELTLALHYAFDSPNDQIIWDVGHQCYTHKIITGRAERFPTLRRAEGLSGFPKRAESPYDVFDTGHAGEAISVALGLTKGKRLLGGSAQSELAPTPGAPAASEARSPKGTSSHKVIAVIGDGSIATGIALEALNHAGGRQPATGALWTSPPNLIVILNDNEMSIAKSTGGFADYLNRITTGRSYNLLRTDVWNLLGKLPDNLSGRARIAAKKVEEGLKNLVAPSVIFEELGFRYFGPFDGHNLITLIDVFKKVRDLNQPILIHVVTRKGKGYPPAEQSPEVFHGIGRFDAATGEPEPGGMTFTKAFGDALVELAARNPKIVAITAGMSLGTGLSQFRTRFPERFYDTGITEQHAVALAAGLALAGLQPVVAIYSTFLARAYDQIIQDVCLQDLPVVFAIDRAGLVGEDGPTHHGTLDLSYLRSIPNLAVMAPADETELKAMLEFALEPRRGPIALRYPRGGSQTTDHKVGVSSHSQIADCRSKIEEGRGVILRPGKEIALLALGAMVLPALAAADVLEEKGIEPLVANMRFLKPLDTELLARVCSRSRIIFTIEENSIAGGFGSAVLEACATFRAPPPAPRIVPIGLPDRFISHASRAQLLQMVGLDARSIAERVLREAAQ